MRTVLSEEHREHFPRGELYGGELVVPFERPVRWDIIVEQLEAVGMLDGIDPDPLNMVTVQKIHDARFLRFLATAWDMWTAEDYDGDAIPTVIPARRMQQREPDHIDGKLGYFCMAIETAITEGTWVAACASAAVAQTAQRLVSEGDTAAFALCRPPGHHAASDLYGGYCFLNNAAIAAHGFIEAGASRVAVLDVDFHHGNGTQDIFYDRSDVMFVSLHGDPLSAFPHFLGFADETGSGAGDGFNANYPMPPGADFKTWGSALEDACARIDNYGPDALVVSLGVDTYKDDPISFFKLDSDDFSTYGARIAALRRPTLFVMEGGYAVEEIGVNTVNVLEGYASA